MSHEEISVAEAPKAAAATVWEYGVKVVTLQKGKWDGDPLLQAGDVIQIGGGALKVTRGKDVIHDMPLVEEFSRWGRGQKTAGDDVVEQLEYTQNSHPSCSHIIYGNFVFEGVQKRGVPGGGTPEPIVGVWGAETPPPGQTDC
jgi:hypothetical protein